MSHCDGTRRTADRRMTVGEKNCERIIRMLWRAGLVDLLVVGHPGFGLMLDQILKLLGGAHRRRPSQQRHLWMRGRADRSPKSTPLAPAMKQVRYPCARVRAHRCRIASPRGHRPGTPNAQASTCWRPRRASRRHVPGQQQINLALALDDDDLLPFGACFDQLRQLIRARGGRQQYSGSRNRAGQGWVASGGRSFPLSLFGMDEGAVGILKFDALDHKRYGATVIYIRVFFCDHPARLCYPIFAVLVVRLRGGSPVSFSQA